MRSLNIWEAYHPPAQYPQLSHWIHIVVLKKRLFLTTSSIQFSPRAPFSYIPPIEDLHTPTSALSDIGISELDMYEALFTLDTWKAMGIGGIGPKILKRCALALYKPLHHLSLSQHSLPSDWRAHLIIPVLKSGDKLSMQNSLLCSVSKILEKLIYDHSYPHLSLPANLVFVQSIPRRNNYWPSHRSHYSRHPLASWWCCLPRL